MRKRTVRVKPYKFPKNERNEEEIIGGTYPTRKCSSPLDTRVDDGAVIGKPFENYDKFMNIPAFNQMGDDIG